jgi:hypothetical protein
MIDFFFFFFFFPVAVFKVFKAVIIDFICNFVFEGKDYKVKDKFTYEIYHNGFKDFKNGDREEEEEEEEIYHNGFWKGYKDFKNGDRWDWDKDKQKFDQYADENFKKFYKEAKDDK